MAADMDSKFDVSLAGTRFRSLRFELRVRSLALSRVKFFYCLNAVFLGRPRGLPETERLGWRWWREWE